MKTKLHRSLKLLPLLIFTPKKTAVLLPEPLILHEVQLASATFSKFCFNSEVHCIFILSCNLHYSKSISELLKSSSWKCFSKHISWLMLWWHILDCHWLGNHLLTDIMHIKLNVLCPTVKYKICCQRSSTMLSHHITASLNHFKSNSLNKNLNLVTSVAAWLSDLYFDSIDERATTLCFLELHWIRIPTR